MDNTASYANALHRSFANGLFAHLEPELLSHVFLASIMQHACTDSLCSSYPLDLYPLDLHAISIHPTQQKPEGKKNSQNTPEKCPLPFHLLIRR